MRKLIESTFVSLDGDISRQLMHWAPPYWDDEYTEYESSLLFGADALVLGRATYEGFSATWPERSGTPYADRINGMPKYVASSTLTDTGGVWNATLLQGDAADAVEALKQQSGQNLLKFGTGSFSRTLAERGLIDEWHLWYFPVVAGTSDSIFDGLPVTHMRLLNTTSFASGIVVNVYAPGGAGRAQR
jgi:dihydrofolate reductase